MFSTILSEITGNLDKRFLMNVFFPALLFSSSLVCLVYINDASDALTSWNDQSVEIQIIMIIAFLFIVTFFAYILDGYLTHILRLYEGYWEGLPLFGRLLGPKKRQHQIIQQINELQAKYLDQEQTCLNKELETIGFEKGSMNSDSHRVDLIVAKESLVKAEGNLEFVKSRLDDAKKELNGAKSKLDDAQNNAGKTLRSWFVPNLDKAENIIVDNGQNGSGKNVEGHLNEAKEQVKKANDYLNIVKCNIILSDPKKIIGIVEKAEGELACSEVEIDALMADLADMKPRSDGLKARLWMDRNKIKSLREDMDGFKEAKKYTYANKAVSDSKQISSSLDSLETDLKSMGSDIFSAKSLPQAAKDHHDDALTHLRTAKKEWNNLSISKMLEEVSRFPEGDEKIAEIKKRTKDAMTEAKRIYEMIYYYYPPIDQPQEVMPTDLGNILKSAEMYPKERYNADAVFFWPKLYPLLSSEWTTALANARGSMDLMILISLLGYSLSILGGLILLLSQAQPFQFLLVFWGSFALGWVAYNGAITYSLTYGDLIRSTFDLHRDKLIAEMGLKAPESIEEEKKFWDDFGQWLYRNARSPNIKYSSAKASKETK